RFAREARTPRAVSHRWPPGSSSRSSTTSVIPCVDAQAPAAVLLPPGVAAPEGSRQKERPPQLPSRPGDAARNGGPAATESARGAEQIGRSGSVLQSRRSASAARSLNAQRRAAANSAYAKRSQM